MSIMAICTVSEMASVNADLEAQGFGPDNFSLPVYDGTNRPSHATLHCWASTPFMDALQADDRVTVSTSETDTPRDRVQAMIDAQGLQWPGNAPLLPDAGTVMPGEYYRAVDGEDTRYWRIVLPHDRSTYGGDPEQYPALIREARIPGRVTEWRQPLDAIDAYLAVEPFTSEPERVTHDNPNDNGALWIYESKIDANTTEPGRDGTFDRWWEPLSLETEYTP